MRDRVLRWLVERGHLRAEDLEEETIEERVERAVALCEGALYGTEPRVRIWTNADYLVAVLAVLTDTDRARRAALAEFARRPVE